MRECGQSGRRLGCGQRCVVAFTSWGERYHLLSLCSNTNCSDAVSFQVFLHGSAGVGIGLD